MTVKHWHLLYTKPREDARAQTNLLNQGYEIFRPLIRHHRIVKGSQRTLVESLFPRYIFIKLDQETSDWARLRSTRGVQSMVTFNQVPAVVPSNLVDELMQEMNGEDFIDRTNSQKALFNTGDEVEISEGSFFGLHAIVKAQTSEERVIVLLNMLGGQQSISLPIAALRLA